MAGKFKPCAQMMDVRYMGVKKVHSYVTRAACFYEPLKACIKKN